MKSDFSSAFKERRWENGENITDGYVYRGKRSFDKVLKGLKENLVKGFQRNIDGIDLKVLDSRKKGVELEIEVEIIDGKNKGIAILKLYGPNKKKENVVTVTRCKGNDAEFVEILAQKILKPMMEEFFRGDFVPTGLVKRKSTSVTMKGKRVNLYKCDHCEMTSYSLPGIKGHMTKKHSRGFKKHSAKQVEVNEVLETPCDEHDMLISKEADRVVDNLISDMINLVDEPGVNLESNDGDSDTDSCVTLEEGSDIKEQKKYSNVCDECDFKIISDRKYSVVQQMLKHKEKLHSRPCDFCEFKAKNMQEMRRHTRDVHALITGSTSPPLKKKKCEENVENVDSNEMMDVESIQNLSSQLDHMDIDDDENENDETLEERSARKDEKVREQQKRFEEEERNQEEIKKKSQAIKATESQIKLEKERKERKMRKQRSKNGKKNGNKMKKRKLSNENEEILKIPNLKNIPPGCCHLVNDGDLVYVVPGDGACGPNSAAAFFFHDEVFGPKLRRRMNEFFVKHYKKRYQDICPCSVDTPFVRMTSSGPVEYTDPEELFKFLLSSDKKSDFMWSDSVDLVVIADMYQVNIKVITIKSSTDVNPTVNWFHPDKMMAKFAELNNVEQNDMVLLHEDDSHFNLIISKDSDLAKLGSLSYRFNVGPLMKKDVEESEVETDEKSPEEKNEDDESKGTELANLKKELKKCKESKNFIHNEYIKCEKELRLKTEEVEKIKIEIKDLRKIVDLTDEINNKSRDISDDKIEGDDSINQVKQLHRMKKKGSNRKSPHVEAVPKEKLDIEDFNCKKCHYRMSTKDQLQRHMKLRHAPPNMDTNTRKEEQSNCMECDFQGHSQPDLKKHINLKHTMKGANFQETIKCRSCGEEFGHKHNLMLHRKNSHAATVAPCRKFSEGSCTFTADACWWNHDDRENRSTEIQCFICSNTFNSKPELMRHRKLNHSNIVPECTQFLKGVCIFQSEFCWYTHKHSEVLDKDLNERKENESSSVFQEVLKNPKPPLSSSTQKAKAQN